MPGPDDAHLQRLRVEYGSVERDGSPDLDADWLADGWVALFRKWIHDAEHFGLAEPNAMVLATVAAGRPASRSVLCKGVDETGITFFTNYDSAKGIELAETPYASATFPWYQLGRQVHIRGPVTKVDPEATRGLLVQAAARIATGRLGVAPIATDRIARRIARPVGRGDRTFRQLDERPAAAGVGRIPHRPRGGGVLAGPGKSGAQPDSGHRRPRRAPATVTTCQGIARGYLGGITRRSPERKPQHRQTRPRAGAPPR